MKTKKAKNVFSIADNPKFKQSRVKPQDKASKQFYYVLHTSVFGFVVGDELICNREFDINEINANTLVIVGNNGDAALTCNVSDVDDVFAIVTGFTRHF
jgi:hypothetical protein